MNDLTPDLEADLPEEVLPEIEDQAIGTVHPNNILNDLTGKQWVYFLNSIWQTCYTRSGKNTHAYELRKSHPSPKPPELLADVIRFFTKQGGKVLDPFAGVGSTLMACAMTGREGIGIELNPDYIRVYEEICSQYTDIYRQMPLMQGDARDLLEQEQIRLGSPYHLIISDPPYSNMLAKPRTRHKGGAATPFTDDDNDIGNIPADDTGIPYATFLCAIKEILEGACSLLVPKGHLIVFCKDLQPNEQHHNLLHADLVSTLSTIPGLRYRGMRIWANMTPHLYPFGYPSAFVANQIHQYMLVFRRELN